jgi:hypothetical protein
MHEAFHLKNHFYTKLEAFTLFEDFTVDRHYKDLPDSWFVVMTDIKGSTKAIQEGHYRDVNLIGAASIIVATKVNGTRDFPFVFGGDGATLLISPDVIDELMNRLAALRDLARRNFNLELRVAKVPMRELRELSKKIEVAKYQLTQGCTMAMMRGEGLQTAEYLIKNHPSRYEHQPQSKAEADLTGLTCRWKPTPSRNGKIFTLIIQSRQDNQKIFEKIMKDFKLIFPDGFDSYNPAENKNGKYKSILENIKSEIRFYKNPFNLSFIQRILEIIPAFFIFNFKLNIAGTQEYVKATKSHSDFIKFDNTLRMVIDCDESKISQLKSLLTEMHQRGDIFFGTHEADEAIMTCFVEGLNQGEHIHFIDSGSGGYALAAIQLKDQMKKAISPN